ncbi:phosphatidylglycerophosphatase A [Ligilactobacillus salitolerans]|uniref:Phosphatidylglycerophosphatase A n=1 Tax=Ligilactobacillus salitolerans TaxID=1808352 RepID=A0A401IS85_9LACO|nr:phosphatidylglycerophosphatase A [Ligilactobacillus salitolerans]GBG94374.1 phosphatidylglycerophosphatase A [Ligilactobacillus salitolerans]
MRTNDFRYPDKAAHDFVTGELAARGITLEKIADIAFDLQKDFFPEAKRGEFLDAANAVLSKREVLNNAMVALELDRLATEGQLKQPLQNIIANDSGVFGVDESIAVSIANIYGTIGVTNFGYLDRVKHGIIKELDTQKNGRVNTFIDDLIGALAAAIAAKMAHEYA